jgi:hypothetical protein
MGLKQTPQQRWSSWGMGIGGVWFIVSLVVGYIVEKLFNKALEDMDGAVNFALSIIFAPWLPALVVGGCFLAWCVFSSRLKKEQQENAEGYYANFRTAWERLRLTRRAFEEKIGSLYATWSRNPFDRNAIKVLAYRAGCPDGLPPTKKHIWQYAREALAEWKGDPGALLDFCTAVYTRRDNQFMPGRDEWKEFDDMRMELSKFWNEWGTKCFNEKVMDEKKMLAIVPGQDWQILLLIYLELAHAHHHYESTGPGKQWLFQLGKMVTRW